MNSIFSRLDESLFELTDLNLYFLELNYIYSPSQKKSYYDLFTYLVNRGYEEEANELWDNVIRQNFIVKPL